MDTGHIAGALILIILVITVTLATLGIFLIRRDKRKHLNCTEKMMGTVIRYTFAERGECVRPPVVEYFVNGVPYRGVLQYSSYAYKRSPFKQKSEFKKTLPIHILKQLITRVTCKSIFLLEQK